MELHVTPSILTPPEPPGIPAPLADVALLNISDLCAAYRKSKSAVWADVAAGLIPAPAIRKPRYTRWALEDIHANLRQLLSGAERAAPAAAAKAKARATHASRAAAAKRELIAKTATTTTTSRKANP
jgi:hypothetical protein